MKVAQDGGKLGGEADDMRTKVTRGAAGMWGIAMLNKGHPDEGWSVMPADVHYTKKEATKHRTQLAINNPHCIVKVVKIISGQLSIDAEIQEP